MKLYNLFATAAMAVALCGCSGNGKEETMDFSPKLDINPPTYICYKLSSPINVDGRIDDSEWNDIPWTSDFVDIEGDKRPTPNLQTRAKMAYDDDGMYFAAKLEEPHVWATLAQHDTVIYFDNDFEIFLNPTNDTHNYLEYEINAFGTDWDLYISKPYRDNPQVLDYFEFVGKKTAVYVDGSINSPTDEDNYWSVEVFFPWRSIYNQTSRNDNPMPKAGQQIRVNFSRVQWTTDVVDGKYVKVPMPGEDKIRENNWVWAPTGVINIHLPEQWGYVQFSDKIAGTEETAFVMDNAEQTKWNLRNLYYRQNEYKNKFGKYAANVSTLKPEEVCSSEEIKTLRMTSAADMYDISIQATDGSVWHIRQDGLVWKY